MSHVFGGDGAGGLIDNVKSVGGMRLPVRILKKTTKIAQVACTGRVLFKKIYIYYIY